MPQNVWPQNKAQSTPKEFAADQRSPTQISVSQRESAAKAVACSAPFRGAARHTLGNQTAAEDVVQETYLQAWKSFHRFAAGTNCRAWLFKILFHVIQHYRRKNWRLQTLGEREEFLLETLPYEAPVPQQLNDEDVLLALNRLPENFRAVILLADVEEFAYKEIAGILNVPIGTVMSRLNRGRKLLRSELTSYAKACGLFATGAANARQMGALAQAA